jgi:hypothetical protein
MTLVQIKRHNVAEDSQRSGGHENKEIYRSTKYTAA